MYNCRVARVEDFEAILPMAKNFYEVYQTTIPFDLESCYRLYLDLIEHGFIVVTQKGTEIVGMLGCMVGPFPLNQNYKVATELMWWMEPEHRGTKGSLMMMHVAEELAKIDGCHQIAMSALANSPSGIAKTYERLGYVYQEGSFVKEL